MSDASPFTTSKIRAASLEAAWENGRSCAEVAFLNCPPPWSEQEAQSIFEQMAAAIMATYPGGLPMFLPKAKPICEAARRGFDERLVELMSTASGPPDGPGN